MKKIDEKLKEYFSGKKLYGDDFNLKQIKKWFEDEKEGYSKLISEDHIYEFHQINKIHGYNKLKNVKKFNSVLSFGGAKGDELLPIIKKIGKIYIVEPSKKLKVNVLQGKKIEYVLPKPDGKIPFKENSFDLITCFGVLHHIPNISFVFKELTRILKKDGYLLIREPIVSMGNWTKPREGLTKRERGIPENIFEKLIKKSNLEIISKKKIMFPLLRRINWGKYRGGNSRFWVYTDLFFSKLFIKNNKYHSTNFFHKLRPQSVFYVLRK